MPEIQEMLSLLGLTDMESLVNRIVPKNIRCTLPKSLPNGCSEKEYIDHLKELAKQNKIGVNFIGQGYYNTFMPPVIQRNVLESAGWYTPYTPYQAEIAQGRLESLFYFQSMICDLTHLPIANASLLDEATAAAEAMSMLYALHKRKNNTTKPVYLIDKHIFIQTKNVLYTRAQALEIDILESDVSYTSLQGIKGLFGVCIQRPNSEGLILQSSDFFIHCRENQIPVCVIADILSLCLMTPPGELGATIAVGSTQRFGVPMGFGGPHAAYIACEDALKRLMPGRIIGKTVDKHRQKAFRMALQTREQHIRREKATSNICTAQALLANIAVMYAIYHGPDGLKQIAKNIATLTYIVSSKIQKYSSILHVTHSHFFDTLKIQIPQLEKVKQQLDRESINVYYYPDGKHIGISIDETTSLQDVNALLNALDQHIPSIKAEEVNIEKTALIQEDFRKRTFLTHEVFQKYHSETNFNRYLKRLEQKDLSLIHAMIPLGSCTMKLNPTTTLLCLSMEEFAHIHPMAPSNQTMGYQRIIEKLQEWLCAITGFDACSVQPNSGAQGELAGLLTIKKYFLAQDKDNRNVVLIPNSAHGTNPASAVMAGLKVQIVNCCENGSIDIDDLKEKANRYQETLAGLMVTYPSTHGIYEKEIKNICDIIHQYGGQVYLDGANMNAQIGLTSPAALGADICHLNLHKTFSIPHGGGGPGAGPICAKKHLEPFLPSQHNFDISAKQKGSYYVSAAPYGSASILIIVYAYIMLMGRKGLIQIAKHAILHANYMKKKIEDHFPILYLTKGQYCAHEFIIDCRAFKKSVGIDVEDISKRLMDYGLHAPTISFPVSNTMMLEPTESESKEALDQYCESLIQIRKEIAAIEKVEGENKDNNLLKNAPHSLVSITRLDTNYSLEEAIFPLKRIKQNKFWPSIGRIDQLTGDRQLICSCMPISFYLNHQE